MKTRLVECLQQAESFPVAMGDGPSADGQITAVAIVGLLVLLIGTIVFIRTRLQIIERRLVVIRTLAHNGQLTRAELDRLLNPPNPLVKILLVVAWFALLGGGSMLAAACLEGWPNMHCDYGVPSLGVLGVALATLSAPVMLKEYRKQGIA